MSLELEAERARPVFEKAVSSLCACLTDLESILPRETRFLEVSAVDEEHLFARWVEELFAVLTEEDTVFRRAEATILRTVPGQVTLRARLWGEPFDRRRHRRKGTLRLAAPPVLHHDADGWRGDVSVWLETPDDDLPPRRAADGA